MAQRNRPTIGKRQRENARAERKRQKAERLKQRRAEAAENPTRLNGEDPDIAGIVPGPQPLPWEDEADLTADS